MWQLPLSLSIRLTFKKRCKRSSFAPSWSCSSLWTCFAISISSSIRSIAIFSSPWRVTKDKENGARAASSTFIWMKRIPKRDFPRLHKLQLSATTNTVVISRDSEWTQGGYHTSVFGTRLPCPLVEAVLVSHTRLGLRDFIVPRSDFF